MPPYKREVDVLSNRVRGKYRDQMRKAMARVRPGKKSKIDHIKGTRTLMKEGTKEKQPENGYSWTETDRLQEKKRPNTLLCERGAERGGPEDDFDE